MFDLFNSELRRYLAYALGLMTAQLAVWGFVYTQQPLLEFGNNENIGTMFFSCGTGLIFGLVQYGLHRLKNRWAWLVHRPLSLAQIHHALFGAGSLLLLIAVAWPFFLVLLLMDGFTNEVVEWRHYVYAIEMGLWALSSYALASYVALSANKGAIAGIGLLAIGIVDGVFSPALIITVQFLIFAAFYYLSRRVLKPNLGEHFKSKREIFIAALVMQPLLGGLLWMSQILMYQLPLLLIEGPPQYQTHPDYRNTMSMVFGLEADEFVDEILKQNNHPQRESLVKQVALAYEGRIKTQLEPQPLRGQPFNIDKAHSLTDPDTGNRWLLSHNEMVLRGLDTQGEIIGYLGAKGFIGKDAQLTDKDRFDSVPVLLMGRYIKTGDRLFMVDFKQQYLSDKFNLPAGEYFTSQLQIDEKVGLALMISNKAIYTFDARQMREYDEQVETVHRIELYKPLADQPYSAFSELADGYLLSFYGAHYYGHNRAGAALVYAKHDGTVELLGEKAFIRRSPMPDWVNHMDFWVSPLVKGYFFSYINGLFKPSRTYKYVTADNVGERYYPPDIVILAIFMAFVSALVTFLLARKIHLSQSQTVFWTLLNLVFGLSGLFAFLLMNHWWGFWRRPAEKLPAGA